MAITSMSNTDALQSRISKFFNEVTVYPVSCEKLANGRSDEEWLDAVLAGGARIVQLRDKESSDLVVYQKAKIFREKTRQAGVLFIVNNRIDIALAAQADGVHLGNSDLPAEEARALAPDLIIGVSANTIDQAATARERGATYYNIGPIFPTSTKEGLSSFLGVEAIKDFSSKSDLPFTVMGGVKFQHIQELVAQGARRLAIVTAINQVRNMVDETRKWHEEILKAVKTT